MCPTPRSLLFVTLTKKPVVSSSDCVQHVCYVEFCQQLKETYISPNLYKNEAIEYSNLRFDLVQSDNVFLVRAIHSPDSVLSEDTSAVTEDYPGVADKGGVKIPLGTFS